MTRLKVFVDANVLFAGAASPTEHSASQVILRMSEITLIDALASEQVVTECKRNLEEKIPDALPLFQLFVSRCLDIVADPDKQLVETYAGLADSEDLPILVAAIRENCSWLVTYNVRHFQPGHLSVRVLRPAEFMMEVRHLLSQLGEG